MELKKDLAAQGIRYFLTCKDGFGRVTQELAGKLALCVENVRITEESPLPVPPKALKGKGIRFRNYEIW